MAPILMSFRASRPYSVVNKVVPAVRRPGIGFLLAVLLSTFLVLAAQAQTDSGSSSSTAPTLTIVSSSATATEGDEVTYTVTAGSAPSSALPVVVQVRAHGEVMDTRTVAEVLLPAGATTVTLRLEEFTDEIDESPVNVTLTLAAGTGYSVGDPAEATVSIDYPSISGTQATPTPAPAVSPPAAPSDVSVSATTINSFTISWTAETGKTYRVEREAAFLFSYRVWQTVSNDLSSGSFTESDLPCGLYYLFQVRAKVTGSAYGDGTKKLGHSQSCPSTTSAGSRNTRDHVDPPKLRVVTDNPTEDKIQIRLLLFGPTGNEEQYTPIPASLGLTDFQVDRSKRVVGSNPKEWPDSGTDLNTNYRKTRQVAEFDWTGLECGASYHFRARSGKRTVSSNQSTVVWGHWSDDASATPMIVSLSMSVHGSTRGCTLQSTPAPAPASVSAVLEGDSSVRVSWTWGTGVSANIVAHKVEWEWHDGTRTRQDSVTGVSVDARSRLVGNLQCSTTYTFKVSGRGDGDPYRTSYGDTKADTASTKLCAPEVDVIPLPGRKMLVSWGRDDQAATFILQVRRQNGSWPSTASSANSYIIDHPNSGNPSKVFELDDMLKNGDSLADYPNFVFRVMGVHASDPNKNSAYSRFTIVDSPIVSVNGDSRGLSRYGRMRVKWNSVGSDAQYTVRWRPVVAGDSLISNHSSYDWEPTEWKSTDAGSFKDWRTKTTTESEYTIETTDDQFGPVIGQIYAVQLNYSLGAAKYYSARERYAWVSNRRGGYIFNGGERVGSFPLNYPLDDPLAPNSKTYAYRICSDTFAHDEEEKLADWTTLIVHAFEQWELATDGLVMMERAVDENGDVAPCADYSRLLNAVSKKIESLLSDSDPPINLDDIQNHLETLSYYTDFDEEDRQRNEIIMLDDVVGDVPYIKKYGVFPGLAKELGFANCIFEAPACAQRTTTGFPVVAEYTTVDILIKRSVLQDDPLTVPTVTFNTCNTPSNEAYYTLVHEAGHALGIRYARDNPPDKFLISHSGISDSVMSFEGRRSCSPHPLDIMAIFALYQSVD